MGPTSAGMAATTGAIDTPMAAPEAGPASPRPPLPRLHVSRLLLGLVLAVLLPTLALGVAATAYAVAGERAAAEGRLRDTAQALALAMDQKIEVNFAALDAFVTSPAFGTGAEAPDLPVLYAQARHIAEKLDVTIYLAARNGLPLLTTRCPLGTPLPRVTSTEPVDRVFATGRPVLGDLVLGAISGRQVFAALAPVFRAGGTVALVVGASFDAEKLRDLLRLANLPNGENAAVSDAKGIIVAVSDPLLNGRIGKPITLESARAFAANGSGLDRVRSDSGVERVVVSHKLDAAPGWTLVVSQPAATFDAMWCTPLLALGGGSALALVLSIGSATFAARRILVPLRQLSAHARFVAMPGGAVPAGVTATPCPPRASQNWKNCVAASPPPRTQ